MEDNCDLLSETYRPNYQIHVTVNMYCKDSSATYEVICSGTGGDSDITCRNFNDGTVYATTVGLTPVE